jgi:2'-5' RNA ligase
LEQVRSFIAIELPDELKLALTRLQERLKSGGQKSVKWVDSNSIHLTLKFLGNINIDMVGKIATTLTVAVRGVSPFRLELTGLGAFPGLNRIQVIWVGLGGDVEQLIKLQQRVESSVVPFGFTPESRPFTPHLTLARVRDEATAYDRQALAKLITGTGLEAAYIIDVDSVHLMRSQLTRLGAIYSRLNSFRLQA